MKLHLFAESLFSKWGFNDGDIPDHIADALDDAGLPTNGWRVVLCRLVREHLVPALDQRVEVTEIETCHNPIRASTVDGVDVEDCWYGDVPKPALTPDAVEIPLDEVIRVVRECAELDDGSVQVQR